MQQKCLEVPSIWIFFFFHFKIFFLSIFIFHWCIYLAILQVRELNACSIVIILLTERETTTDILTIFLMHHYLAFACAKCTRVRKQCRMCPKHKSIIVFAGVLSIALKGAIHLSIISLAVSNIFSMEENRVNVWNVLLAYMEDTDFLCQWSCILHLLSAKWYKPPFKKLVDGVLSDFIETVMMKKAHSFWCHPWGYSAHLSSNNCVQQ